MLDSLSFSKKHGYQPIEMPLQLESINDNLRHYLWNELFYMFEAISSHFQNASLLEPLIWVFWTGFFNKLYDDLPVENLSNPRWLKYLIQTFIKREFLLFKWHVVYDFLQFTAHKLKYLIDKYGYLQSYLDSFTAGCDRACEKENAPYRFIDNCIVRITDTIEITAIEAALSDKDCAAEHISQALKLLSHKEPGSDYYRQSCHESISAVEAIARKITGKTKESLGELCKQLQLHKGYQKGLSNIFGYTSDEGGIRHSITDDMKNVNYEDAIFMLTMCSAFVNYIKSKP